METARDISKSVHETIETIRFEYNNSNHVQDLKKLDRNTKRRNKMEGRELSDWNAVIFHKCRKAFDIIVQTVCERNGRSEAHVRKVTGWKRGKNITNLNIEENE